jgi:hypothetical protein
MPLDEYRKDFEESSAPGAAEEFERLLALAITAPEMPLIEGNTIETIAADPARRALQYREVGRFIVRHCHILLSLWDGDASAPKPGGTAEIVQIQRGGRPLTDAESVRASLDGVDIGPFIHIVTPRRNSHSAGLAVATRPWGRELRRDARAAAALHVDAEAWRAFDASIRLTTRFNLDAKRIVSSYAGARKVEKCRADLFDAPDDDALATKAHDYCMKHTPLWREAYAVADALAQDYQSRFFRTWAQLFSLGFLMASALALVGAANETLALYALLSYQALIVASYCLYRFALSRHLQAKFLDYRALCEATRVAIFWRVAGIGRSIGDAYPICQSDELGWVKTSLLSLECLDGGAAKSVAPLDDVRYRICETIWVEGQVRYFTRRAKAHVRVATTHDRWSGAAIFVATVGTALIALAHHFDLDWERSAPLVAAFAPIALALLPAAAAALNAHAEQLGRTAQALQYDRLRSLYRRARELLPRSLEQIGAHAARQVFVELGREALQETASWTSIFRIRPLRPYS